MRTIARILTTTMVAGALFGLALPATAGASPAALTNCTISPDPVQDQNAVALDAEETAMVQRINAFRGQNGRPALSVSARLNRPAAWASNDSARRGFSPSNHVDTLGRDIPTRLQQCDYTGFGWASEINYYGWGTGGTGDAAFSWWLQSPPHRAAILDTRVTSIGVGRVSGTDKVHWTVNMGDRA